MIGCSCIKRAVASLLAAAPEPGSSLRANVGRKRHAKGWELQSWSPQLRGSGFDYGVEFHRFGTWVVGN